MKHRDLTRLAGGLTAAAADPAGPRALLAFVAGGLGEAELRVPPGEILASTEAFLSRGMSAIACGLDRAGARCVGLLLPVRSIGRRIAICPGPDAEAALVAAAEDVGDGALSLAVMCAIHALPHGWREVHADLEWLTRPLRAAVARRPLADDEAFSYSA